MQSLTATLSSASSEKVFEFSMVLSTSETKSLMMRMYEGIATSVHFRLLSV